jgi:hypothetical protein
VVIALWVRYSSMYGRWGVDRSPRFVGYASGDAIFRGPPGEIAPEFRRATLTPAEQTTLWGAAQVEPLSHLGGEEHQPVPGVFFVSNCTDNPTYLLQWRTPDGVLHQVSVDGALDEGSRDRERTPVALLKVIDSLLKFSAPRATPFEPEGTIFLLSPFKSRGEAPVPWPSGWPLPPSEAAHDLAGGFVDVQVRIGGRDFSGAAKWVGDVYESVSLLLAYGRTWMVEVEAELPGAPAPLPEP